MSLGKQDIPTVAALILCGLITSDGLSQRSAGRDSSMTRAEGNSSFDARATAHHSKSLRRPAIEEVVAGVDTFSGHPQQMHQYVFNGQTSAGGKYQLQGFLKPNQRGTVVRIQAYFPVTLRDSPCVEQGTEGLSLSFEQSAIVGFKQNPRSVLDRHMYEAIDKIEGGYAAHHDKAVIRAVAGSDCVGRHRLPFRPKQS